MKIPLHSRVIGLDTETTGLGINDVPVGVSLSDGLGYSTYLAWGHEGGGNIVTQQQVASFLNEKLEAGTIIAMHNAVFDLRMLLSIGVDLLARHRVVDVGFMAAILNPYELAYTLAALAGKYLGEEKPDDELNARCAEAFGGKPVRSAISKGVQVGQAQNYWRAPAGWVREYAEWDAWATAQLYQHYQPIIERSGLEGILQLELDQMGPLLRMKLTGVPVDVAKAEQHHARISTELNVLEEEWDRAYDVPLKGKGSKTGLIQLWSDQGLPFERTPKGNPSISKALVSEHAPTNEVARLLHEIRPREKFRTTFLGGYILDSHVDGRLHPDFHSVKSPRGGTITGRFSSSNPNLQNPPSPKRDNPEWPEARQYGHLFRSMFLPEEGSEWLSVDYSQIEYRFFAHYAGGAIRDAFNEDPDIDFHQWCADMAGVSRSDAKNGNFAKLYGAGTKRLADTLGITQEEAKQFIAEYDAAIPEAASLFQRAVFKAEQRGYVTTWAGRRSLFPYHRGRYIMTHAALNYLLQGSAADLMKRAIVAVDRVIDWDECKLHLTVHDELNLSHPIGSKWPRLIKEAMEDFELTVPIVADVEVGPNWGNLKGLTV
jgi:DNA polymerase-1